MRQRHTKPGQRSVREVFERAEHGLVSDVARLRELAPEIVAEARRRNDQPEVDLLTSLVPLAWKAVPRFAAVAALLAIVAVGLSFTDKAPVEESISGADRLLLTGSLETDGDDWLLEAIVGDEEDDG